MASKGQLLLPGGVTGIVMDRDLAAGRQLLRVLRMQQGHWVCSWHNLSGQACAWQAPAGFHPRWTVVTMVW